jgi:hypothetical protein
MANVSSAPFKVAARRQGRVCTAGRSLICACQRSTDGVAAKSSYRKSNAFTHGHVATSAIV